MTFTRQGTIDSELLHSDLADLLRRAGALGDSNRVTDQLRSEGVDKVHFDFGPIGVLRITPVGLESGGGRSLRLAVEGRLRLLSGPSGNPRIQLEVALTRGSWLRMLIWPALFVVLALVQLFQHPPSFGGLGIALFFASLLSGGELLRALDLLDRAWPGLHAMARRVAEGSLYVPAA